MGTYRYWQRGKLTISKDAREKWEDENPEWLDGGGLPGHLDIEGWNAEAQEDDSIVIEDGDEDNQIPDPDDLDATLFTPGSFVEWECEGGVSRMTLLEVEGTRGFVGSDSDRQEWFEPSVLSTEEILVELERLTRRAVQLNAELTQRGAA